MIGVIYFLVIVVANTIGAISGMGGGILIKPLLDFIGVHSVVEISFYSSVAVFTMSIVSTGRHLISGKKINWSSIAWMSGGAIIGWFLGNEFFEILLISFNNENVVQLIQIILTVLMLIFSYMYTKYEWCKFQLKNFFGIFFVD